MSKASSRFSNFSGCYNFGNTRESSEYANTVQRMDKHLLRLDSNRDFHNHENKDHAVDEKTAVKSVLNLRQGKNKYYYEDISNILVYVHEGSFLLHS